MVGQVVTRSSPANRRTPLLMAGSPTTMTTTTGTPLEKRQFREVAGGATAECAAVCCCCPCSVLDLIVTVVYRVPAGICRRAWKRTAKRHRCSPNKKGLLQRPNSPPEEIQQRTREELEVELKRVKEGAKKEENIAASAGAGNGLPETGDFSEKEMWDRFYGTGFWRSPSQRES